MATIPDKPMVGIVGSGGMLGRRVLDQLTRHDAEDVHRPPKLAWQNTDETLEELSRWVTGLMSSARRQNRPWKLVWTAGLGVPSSPEELLAAELSLFSSFLAELAVAQHTHGSPHGSFILASSAGGLHTKPHQTVTESTIPTPTSAYGRAKLQMEEDLRSMAASLEGVSPILCRLTTLYGPGQNLQKQQGLVAHMGRCVARKEAIHIYVPLDTMRDYLYVDDAARAIGNIVRSPHNQDPSTAVRVIASERETSISELIATFRRIARKSVLVVHRAIPLAAGYPTVLRFRSFHRTLNRGRHITPLVEGIQHMLLDQRQLLWNGQLK